MRSSDYHEFVPVTLSFRGEDENVPVWNTRELIGILRAWNPSTNVRWVLSSNNRPPPHCLKFRLREDPGEGHWYSSVLNNSEVESFVNEMAIPGNRRVQSDAFTLTVTIPAESGPLHGWSIEQLKIPGRCVLLTHISSALGSTYKFLEWASYMFVPSATRRSESKLVTYRVSSCLPRF